MAGLAPPVYDRPRAERNTILPGPFAVRVATGAVCIPIVLYAAWRGTFVWFALVGLAVGLGLFEFYRMMSAKGLRPYRILGVASGILLIWSQTSLATMDTNFLFAVILLVLMTLELARGATRYAVYHLSTTIFGVVYVGWLGSHLVQLRELPLTLSPTRPYAEGFLYVALALVITWAGDTGAYLIGSRWGKRPLAPRISPRKTVEGAIGGLLGGILGAVLIAAIPPHVVGYRWAVVLGLVGSVAGQSGDLVESLIKRDVHIKDSARVLPGHGGILDRLDSVLFAVPVLYYLLRFVVLR